MLDGSRPGGKEAVTRGEVGRRLAAGRDVAIAGFGKFTGRDRAAREGRNPATGQTIQIAACRVAKFSAASALKAQLNR